MSHYIHFIVLIRNSPVFIMWLKILLRLGNLGAFHHNLCLFLRWFCSLNLTTFPLWMIFAEFPKCNSTISNMPTHISLFPLRTLKSIFVMAPRTSHVKSSTPSPRLSLNGPVKTEACHFEVFLLVKRHKEQHWARVPVRGLMLRSALWSAAP